jgi:thiol-disulfide isomerase/thioredoxin
MTYSLVYIGAVWCGTCKVIKPKVEELVKKFGISYKVLDYDDDLEEEDKQTVTKVPTLRIYDGEVKVWEYNVNQVESLASWLSANVSLISDF